ncbi:hypothetical protein BH23ACT11_BH23ACT11_27160 [soil metagenome]
MLLETSCWVEHFNHSGTQRADAVEEAVKSGHAALTGSELAELLQGARTERELSRLQASLGAVEWVETSCAI